jgi:hypothetical protein
MSRWKDRGRRCMSLAVAVSMNATHHNQTEKELNQSRNSIAAMSFKERRRRSPQEVWRAPPAKLQVSSDLHRTNPPGQNWLSSKSHTRTRDSDLPARWGLITRSSMSPENHGRRVQ